MFRYYYFNEFLPNTFFLKLGGGQLLTRLSNSLYVLHENIAFYFFPMFLLLFLKKRDLKQFLANPLSSIFISIFFVQVLYHLYTGGDAWDNIVMPNRFLSSALPFLLILFSLMLSQLISSRE